MKRVILSISVLAVSVFLLASCGLESTQAAISGVLGIDVSEGEVISKYDTHSGNGDGVSCVIIRFDNGRVLEEMESNAEWKEFPPDETVQTLVYGASDGIISAGPFLNDEDGNPLVPEIRNGYYLLIDRHADTEKDILHRASFNFTLGIYDTDTNTLYFCKLDT